MQGVEAGRADLSLKSLVSQHRRKNDRLEAGTLASNSDSSIHLLCDLAQVTKLLCSYLHLSLKHNHSL